MRKTILSLGIALSLLGVAGADEVAVTEGQRSYITRENALVGPTVSNLKADLQAEGLVGTFSQRPVELEATQGSPQLVNDDFIIRPRPQRLEEILPNIPDRSRTQAEQPGTTFDLINFSLY